MRDLVRGNNLLPICALLLVAVVVVNAELQFLIQVTRHGARTPVNLSYNITGYSWFDGEGQLTSSGMRQHYLMGREMRYRYIENLKFLPEEYDPQVIWVRSTWLNRTILSAYSNMIGMYPLGTGGNLNSFQQSNAVPMIHVDDLAEIQKELGPAALIYNYNPIPIHGIENDTDHVLLNMDAVNCPIAGPIRDQLAGTTLMKHYNDQFSLCLYPELHKLFGVPLAGLNTSTVYSYGDEIVAAEYQHPEHKYPLTDCAREQLYEAMDIGIYDQIYGSDLLTRLASTLFFQRIVSDFDMVVQFEADKAKIRQEISQLEEMLLEEYDHATEEKIKKLKQDTEEKRRKFIYYSAHDTTVAAFLSGMLNKQSEFPPFASQLLYEFHKDSSSNMGPEGYYVRITYNDMIIRIPNSCKNAPTCDYATFKKFLQGRMFQGDVVEECNKTEVDWDYMFDDNVYTLMIVAAIILALFAIVMIKMVAKQSRKEEKKQQFYITSN